MRAFLHATALLTLLGAGAAHPQSWVLSDPTSEVYYRYLAAAGERLDVDGGARLTGELRSNDHLRIRAGATVDGDVTAAGEIDDRGTGSGARTSGAPELELPALTEPAAFEALADRRTYEPTLAPPIVVTGLLGVLLDLEGRQELAPVGTLADCSKVLSDCFAPAR